MAVGAKRAVAAFDAASFRSFRFVSRELSGDGSVALTYALDDELTFTERIELPVGAPLGEEAIAGAEGLLSLLHWVAGVSYFKAALPPAVELESGAPGPAAARLLEALYSEGLGSWHTRTGSRRCRARVSRRTAPLRARCPRRPSRGARSSPSAAARTPRSRSRSCAARG